MIRTESSGGWQNRDCSIALPYVCKKKPNATAAEPPPPGEPGSRGACGWGSSGPQAPAAQPPSAGGSDPPCSLMVQLKSEQTEMCH